VCCFGYSGTDWHKKINGNYGRPAKPVAHHRERKEAGHVRQFHCQTRCSRKTGRKRTRHSPARTVSTAWNAEAYPCKKINGNQRQAGGSRRSYKKRARKRGVKPPRGPSEEGVSLGEGFPWHLIASRQLPAKPSPKTLRKRRETSQMIERRTDRQSQTRNGGVNQCSKNWFKNSKT